MINKRERKGGGEKAIVREEGGKEREREKGRERKRGRGRKGEETLFRSLFISLHHILLRLGFIKNQTYIIINIIDREREGGDRNRDGKREREGDKGRGKASKENTAICNSRLLSLFKSLSIPLPLFLSLCSSPSLSPTFS